MRYDGVHCSGTSETGDPRNQVLQLTSCPHVLGLVKSFEVESWCVHGRLSKSNVLKYFKTGILKISKQRSEGFSDKNPQVYEMII